MQSEENFLDQIVQLSFFPFFFFFLEVYIYKILLKIFGRNFQGEWIMETFDFITHFRKVKKNLVPSRQSVVGME